MWIVDVSGFGMWQVVQFYCSVVVAVLVRVCCVSGLEKELSLVLMLADILVMVLVQEGWLLLVIV